MLPTGILGTPDPFREFINVPLEAIVAMLLYEVSKTLPEGEFPEWQPEHEDWIKAVRKQKEYQSWLDKNYAQRPEEVK